MAPGSVQVYRGGSKIQYNWAKQSVCATSFDKNLIACSVLYFFYNLNVTSFLYTGKNDQAMA